MRVVRHLIMTVALILFAGIGTANATINNKPTETYLYALSADGGYYDGETLTLKNIPYVIYFTDRPYRNAGHIGVEKFLEIWNQAPNNLKKNPPNAVLMVYDKKGSKSAVMVLSNMTVKGSSISYKAKILKGSLTNTFGAVSLFLDMIDPEFGLRPALK